MEEDLGFVKLLNQYLDEEAKEPDGLLHCSGLATCEYGQLQVARGEVFPGQHTTIDKIVMMTGTNWHKWIQERMGQWIHYPEVDLTDYLPEGWGGSTDGLWLMERGQQKERLFALIDIKTMNGEGMRFIKGVKPEHKWQVSAYHLGAKEYLKRYGLGRLYHKAVVIYMPVSRAKGMVVEPIECWFEPHSEEATRQRMDWRAHRLEQYQLTGENPGSKMPMVIYTKRNKYGDEEVHIKKNWYTDYCPAMDCPCSVRKGKKIGVIRHGEYIALDAEWPAEIVFDMMKHQNGES